MKLPDDYVERATEALGFVLIAPLMAALLLVLLPFYLVSWGVESLARAVGGKA